jgi:hypothetical protein
MHGRVISKVCGHRHMKMWVFVWGMLSLGSFGLIAVTAIISARSKPRRDLSTPSVNGGE